jgi:hypothetical protein
MTSQSKMMNTPASTLRCIRPKRYRIDDDLMAGASWLATMGMVLHLAIGAEAFQFEARCIDLEILEFALYRRDGFSGVEFPDIATTGAQHKAGCRLSVGAIARLEGVETLNPVDKTEAGKFFEGAVDLHGGADFCALQLGQNIIGGLWPRRTLEDSQDGLVVGVGFGFHDRTVML